MLNDKTYIVFPDGATHPFRAFLITLNGSETSAWGSIYERTSCPADHTYKITDRAPRSDFDSYSEIGGSKDWDGTTRFRVDTDGNTDPDSIALYLKTVAYLCDQFMAAEGTGSYDFNTREKSLQRLNCGDGADKNPGITYEEFVPLDEEDESLYEVTEVYNPNVAPIVNKMESEIKKLLGIEVEVDAGDSLVIPLSRPRFSVFPEPEPIKEDFRNSLAVSLPFTKKDK
jgi:hypothetical protein